MPALAALLDRGRAVRNLVGRHARRRAHAAIMHPVAVRASHAHCFRILHRDNARPDRILRKDNARPDGFLTKDDYVMAQPLNGAAPDRILTVRAFCPDPNGGNARPDRILTKDTCWRSPVEPI